MPNPVEGIGGVIGGGAGALDLQLLFQLPNANMAITTDQQFTKMFNGTVWDPTYIVVYLKSGVFGTACAGGVYSAASKGGSAIVAVGQSYAGLTGANTHVVVPVQATAVDFSITPFLSLTTGNTGALVADYRIYGLIVS